MANELRKIPLRDLIEFTRDGEWGSDQPGAERVEMLVVRGTDFARLRCGELDRIPRRFIASGMAERKKLFSDDVLIETAGGTKDQPTGRTVLIKKQHLDKVKLPFTCSSFSRLLRFDRTKIDPRFIYWWLQNLYASGEMETHQVQHTGVARFQFTKFAESTLVPVPPLHEQRAIAHILGTLDDKIELNRRMNETLEAMARALFKSWFVDFDPVRAKAEGRDPGLPKEIAELFPDRFEDSELGEIPAGWKFEPLPDVIDVNPTRALRKGEKAPYLDMANMPTRGHSPDDVVGRAFGSGIRFKNGDTLVARITPCLENGKTAFVDFLKGEEVGWGSTEYIVLRPKLPLPEEFAYCLARSEEFRDFAIQSMTGSSGRQRVPVEVLSHFRVMSAPKPIAELFGCLIKPLFARASAATREGRALATLRDTLLPKIMSGKLRVQTVASFLGGFA